MVAAEAWTHNRRIACVLYVNDNATSRAVDDPERLSAMEEQLNNVLRGCEQEDEKFARTSLSIGSTHVDRRLHQMFFADKDYEAVTKLDDFASRGLEPKITVEHCEEKGYSVINVSCEDRPKLMFDIVCTLTDMQYIVFHATISSSGSHASQEYFIRHKDGCTLDTEGEKERVVKCLEAAIHRRVSEVSKHILLVHVTCIRSNNFLSYLSENTIIGLEFGALRKGQSWITVGSDKDSERARAISVESWCDNSRRTSRQCFLCERCFRESSGREDD